jgi:hypothetical protein
METMVMGPDNRDIHKENKNKKEKENEVKKDENAWRWHGIYKSTLNCISMGCVPCLYKVFPLGMQSIHPSLYSILPYSYPSNTRPENCKRSSSKLYQGIQSLSKTILVVGDGDFSFSLAIARSKPLQARHHLVATSYETETSLTSIYTEGAANIASLRALGVLVLFEVDATKLSNCRELLGRRFDQVVWNFPCICVDRGLDGQATELEQNQALVSKFFRNLKEDQWLESDAQVMVTHKTIEPFSWWDITKLAKDEGFNILFDLVFDKYNYPGYRNRKALDKKSFTCNDARV